MDKDKKPGRPPKYGGGKPRSLHIRLSEETYEWIKKNYQGKTSDFLEKIARGEIKLESDEDNTQQ